MNTLDTLFSLAADTDTVVFDIGNVLLRFDAEGLFRQMVPGVIREPLFRATFFGKAPWCWSSFDEGLIPHEEIARRIAESAGLDSADAAYVLFVLNNYHRALIPMPLSEGIPALKAMGKKIYALTNYPVPQLDDAWNRFSFFRYFDGRVVSGEERLVKPNAAFYRILETRYHVSPRTALYIDDNGANIQTGRELGYRVWHYDFME